MQVMQCGHQHISDAAAGITDRQDAQVMNVQFMSA